MAERALPPTVAVVPASAFEGAGTPFGGLAAAPGARVVVVVGPGEDPVPYLRAGAHGVVEASAPPSARTAAVAAVEAGLCAVPAGRLASAVARAEAAHRDQRREALLRRLSPRELEVLRYVAGGATRTAVAAALSISPETVAAHLRRAFHKLDVRSWAAAAELLHGPGQTKALRIEGSHTEEQPLSWGPTGGSTRREPRRPRRRCG